MSEKELVWVHPNFKKMLKKKAADQGTSIINMTENMSKKIDLPIERRRNGFQRFKL